MMIDNFKKFTIVLVFSLIGVSLFLADATNAADVPIKEIVTQDPANKDYMAAITLMKEPVYVENTKDYWDVQNQKWIQYPLVRLGYVDLNEDAVPEIIAYPVELVPYEEGVLCKIDGCPNFIFSINDKGKVRLLSVINAHTVRVDSSLNEGYNRLKAHVDDPDKGDPTFFDLYQYETKSKIYVRMKL